MIKILSYDILIIARNVLFLQIINNAIEKMLRIIGKLSDKSLFREGVSEHGKWRIVKFIIEKTRQRKKIKIVFTAKGRLADLVFSIPLKEKLDIHFFPDCKEANGNWYTELQVISVEKYIPLSKQHYIMDGDHLTIAPELALKTDLQLFDITKKEDGL